jgi:hypothetical protein
VLDLGEQVTQIRINLKREGIETVGPVKRDYADATGHSEPEVFPLRSEFGRRTKRAH